MGSRRTLSHSHSQALPFRKSVERTPIFVSGPDDKWNVLPGVNRIDKRNFPPAGIVTNCDQYGTHVKTSLWWDDGVEHRLNDTMRFNGMVRSASMRSLRRPTTQQKQYERELNEKFRSSMKLAPVDRSWMKLTSKLRDSRAIAKENSKIVFNPNRSTGKVKRSNKPGAAGPERIPPADAKVEKVAEEVPAALMKSSMGINDHANKFKGWESRNMADVGEYDTRNTKLVAPMKKIRMFEFPANTSIYSVQNTDANAIRIMGDINDARAEAGEYMKWKRIPQNSY